MSNLDSSALVKRYAAESGSDKVTALVLCELCQVCRRARKKQAGVAFAIFKNVESYICPFCRAYERVHGRKAHQL
jgi:hypothetical protein